MTLAVRTHPATPVEFVHHARRALNRQAMLIAAALFVVVWVDQTSKAWAWRNVDDARINSGGNALTGAHLNDWLRDPTLGAVLDVVDCALLVAAGLLLARVRRSPAVTLFGAVALAGWSSNLLDRLGMHFVTAPGSVRGAVDFLPWGGHYWNLADVAIIAGTTGLALALLTAAVRANGPRHAPLVLLTRRPLRSPWAPVVVTAGLVAVAVLATYGAVHHTGIDRAGYVPLFG